MGQCSESPLLVRCNEEVLEVPATARLADQEMFQCISIGRKSHLRLRPDLEKLCQIGEIRKVFGKF